MKSVEKSAKTYEEAVELALQELGAQRGDVDILTLDEGSKGLFGLFGSRPYRIRVTLKVQEEEPEDELDVLSLLSDPKPAKPKPAPKAKPAPSAEKPEKPEKPAEAPAEAAQDAEEKTEGRSRRPEPVRRVNPQRKSEQPAPVPAEEAPAETAEAAAPAESAESEGGEQPQRSSRSHRRGRGRGRGRRAEGEKPQTEAAEQPEKAEKPEQPVRREMKPLEKPEVTWLNPEEIDPESAVGKAKAFLQELTGLMGTQVEISMGQDADGNIYGRMTGDTLGVLIGRHGETLDALQYLTSLNVNRGQEHYTRVTLDTENYRAKREDTLMRLANRMANRAVKTGRRVALEAMNPYERRIIHSALQGWDEVETHSEGEEPNRHVVITLKK